MTGRYFLNTPAESTRDERLFDAAWRKFAQLCRSLHRDGLIYDVQFNLNAAEPHVMVTASGTAKPRRLCARRAVHSPVPVQVKDAALRRIEVEWFLPENRARRNDATSHWKRRQSRYEELSEMAEEQLRTEHEYWHELELLSGQREHFKPGRTDETVYADDEVAA